MTSYLDTQVVAWLAGGDFKRISPRALSHMEEGELLISPMALLELGYLYEIKRITLTAREIFSKLEHEVGIRVCTLPLASITFMALDETWTRDPFDRILTAHAKSNGFAYLVTADEEIRAHYPRAVW